MPVVSASLLAWREAVQHMPADIQHFHDALLDVVCLDIYEPAKVLVSLSKINKFLLSSDTNDQNISWRQLSAFFFCGDSKYLDSPVRRALLLSLLPQLENRILERPLQLSVFLVSGAKAILLVENWDTFLGLIKHKSPGNFHILYTAGFKASAKNVRQATSVHFFYSGDFSSIHSFESFWFNPKSNCFDIYFLGDLDYSGLEILNKLSVSFPDIKAWQQGYGPMLVAVSSGYGHSASQTNKERQKISSNVACDYARETLLPALDETRLMLDQEWLLDI